jgi:hypothetical protein
LEKVGRNDRAGNPFRLAPFHSAQVE